MLVTLRVITNVITNMWPRVVDTPLEPKSSMAVPMVSFLLLRVMEVKVSFMWR